MTSASSPRYQFKTKPLGPFQRQAFLRSRDREFFGILFEQGCGKSWVDINATAWAHAAGLIDGWAIVAPNGVHRNWVVKEIPKHWPDRVPIKVLLWKTGRAGSKGFAEDFEDLLGFAGCAVLAMNIDAVRTERGRAFLKRFLVARQSKLTVDESSKIKTPGTKRTKLITGAGKLATQRRILTGTPVTRGPLDLYSQLNFLDRSILGFGSFYVFKHHFAEWETGWNGATETEFEQLVGYRHLDELRRLIAPHTTRVLKKDVLKHLPPKLYTTWYAPLSERQRSVYDRLRDEFVVELETERITAAMAITRLMRLQQITSGYLPSESGELILLDDYPARLRVVLERLEEVEGKVIIWARFQPDLQWLERALRKEYGADAVTGYHGGVKQRERDAGLDAFQDPASPVRFFVGQQQAGGYGLDLTVSSTTVYYSNSFSNEDRWQTEDRPHREGQTANAVLYADVESPGTVDETIAESLRAGRNLAAEVNGDNLKEWLR